MTTRYEDKDPTESVVVIFDFSKATTSVTLPTVSAAVKWSDGTPDPAPSTVLSGVPTISGTNAAHVLQRVLGGLAWNDYSLRCVAQGANGDTLLVDAVLPVRTRP